MNKKISLILIIFNFTFALQAKQFRHLTSLEGLSQNDVNCIFQDSRGFMWIGTNDGLNRYDGYNFKIYRKQPRQQNGLVGNIIQCITEDRQGNLWIGTSDNGVCKFDVTNNLFTSFSNTVQKPDLLLSNRIFSITSDDYGNIWLVTPQGVNIIKTETGNIFQLDEEGLYLPENVTTESYVRDIHIDKKGNVWAGTYAGIRKIDPETFKVKKTYVGPRGLRGASRFLEWNNNLLIQNSKGVQSFNRRTKEFGTVLDLVGGNNLDVDNDGNLWIATNDGLVYATIVTLSPLKYKIEHIFKGGIENEGLTKDVVTYICKDNSGLIWIGTNGGGVNVYNPNQKLFKHYSNSGAEGSITYNKIRSISEDKFGGIWIGTDGDGLNYQPPTKNVDYAKGFIHKEINRKVLANRGYVLAEDTVKSMMWLGTGYPSKVKVYSTKTGNEIDISKWDLKVGKSVFTVLIDSKHCIWLGSYGDGLWRLTPTEDGGYLQDNFRKEDKSYSLPSDLIRSLLEDKNGNIWVGTAEGLVKIKKKHKYSAAPKFFTYQNIPNDPKSISHSYILPIYESTTGDIWVGTLGGGLNRYRESEDGIVYFESYTTNEGLPNNVVKGILEDEDNNLWISTNRGLTKFNVETKKTFNYDVGDGLQDYEFSEFACYKRRSGEMMFGGVNGFNTFFPKQIKQDKSVSEVVFTRLDILNQPVEVNQTISGRVLLTQDINEVKDIRLKFAENSFTVYYAGLHFAAPRKNQYKYMLEGFDETWITTTSDARFAKYTNLKPGDYRLKVMATNSDGVWNPDPKILNVTVIAPWWLSNYALLSYIVVIVVLLIFFRRFSIIGIQQKNQLLMERFEKEKVEELSQLKLRFFTNISHEFRTPLTLIIGPIEKLIKEKAIMSGEKIDKVHDIIHRNANVLLRLINQLMDFRKFEQGKMKLKASQRDVVKFVKDIYASFEIYAEQKDIQFLMAFSSNQILLWFDAEKLEKVIYNLLSNAFKFTPNGGSISINVSEKDTQVYITVQDTGVGMDSTMKSQVFERFFQADQKENKYGSTGIGLAYSKGLVEMHKGVIEVESQVDKGTQFIVKLKKGKAHLSKKEIFEGEDFQPIEDAVWVNNSNNTDTEKEDSKEETLVGKKRLLVVEDNIELRSFIKESLSGLYHIVEAENGEVGLELCKSENPDLIVSDVMMPKMDGFEMCKAIKEDVDVSHTPIILLTAKTSSEHRVKGYSLGADSYVSKPFDLEVLKAQINNLLAKREQLKANFDHRIEVTPTEIASTSMDEKFLSKILRIIEAKMGDSEFTVEELSVEYGVSKVILNRKLKALTGKTAKIFIRSIRLKRAAQLLSMGRYSVADVTYEVGFSDLKYFRTCFKNEIGVSPSDYKRQHAGEGEEQEGAKEE